MEKQIIEQWDKFKGNLESYFTNTPMSNYDSYNKIVKQIIINVLNAGDDNGLNLSPEFTTIDDGDYQGTKVYILHINTYQPCISDYFVTHNYYGSCSGCDALQSIMLYEEGLPNETQVKKLMSLSLHLIQRIKSLINLYQQ